MYAFVDQAELLVAFSPVGPFQQNQSLVVCKKTGKAAIIDPGGDPDLFLAIANERQVEIVAILLTHAHIDHVAGLGPTKDRLPNVPIFLHPLDKPVYEAVPKQGAAYGFPVPPLPSIDHEYEEGEIVDIGDLRLQVLHTPGHAPGHVCLQILGLNAMIGGDLLFRQSIGRTDLPLCDPSAMTQSLRRILTLDNAVRVLPGHGQPTTIGFERENNPFLQGL